MSEENYEWARANNLTLRGELGKIAEMELRDRFAMAALAGLMTSEASIKIRSQDEYQLRMEAVCEVAYEFADQMLAQRKKDA